MTPKQYVRRADTGIQCEDQVPYCVCLSKTICTKEKCISFADNKLFATYSWSCQCTISHAHKRIELKKTWIHLFLLEDRIYAGVFSFEFISRLLNGWRTSLL